MVMRALEKLKSVGQSLWLGHLSRQSIGDGSLRHAIEDWSVTGLAFSPQAVYQALAHTDAYDDAIARKLGEGLYGESLASSFICEDTRYAADLLRPVYDRTEGVDGWAVLPVSPLSAAANHSLVLKYRQICEQSKRPNTLLCVPALAEQLPDIEELVVAGMPITIANVYSDAHYAAVAKTCLAGIERRLEAGFRPGAPIFISVNIGRLEAALQQRTDSRTATVLAVAMACKIYRTLRELNNSQEWNRIFNSGVRPLRLIWGCFAGDHTGEIDCFLYRRLIAPCTVVSFPHSLISNFVAQNVDDAPMPVDGGDCDLVLADSIQAGLDVESLADTLQREYLGWLSREWVIMLESFARKSAALTRLETFG
jgi:transaldolase